MARSLSSAKLRTAASLSDCLSLSIFRRAYAAAEPRGPGPVSIGVGLTRSWSPIGRVNNGPMVMGKEDESPSTSWAPDPITGYYRPANSAAEMDPAELRAMLLNHRIRSPDP